MGEHQRCRHASSGAGKVGTVKVADPGSFRRVPHHLNSVGRNVNVRYSVPEFKATTTGEQATPHFDLTLPNARRSLSRPALAHTAGRVRPRTGHANLVTTPDCITPTPSSASAGWPQEDIGGTNASGSIHISNPDLRRAVMKASQKRSAGKEGCVALTGLTAG